MTVQEIMTKNPTCCTPETLLDEVARLMVECDCGAIPIVEDMKNKRPVGIVTDRDIIIRVLAKGEDCLRKGAEAAMTPTTETIRADANIREAEAIMKEKQIRRIIVVDDEDTCVGILAQADIARHRSDVETGDVVEEISEPALMAGSERRGQ